MIERPVAICNVIGCTELAEYEIREVLPPPEPYSDAHACLAHIPELMTDAIVHEVVKLKAPGDPSPVYR